jgi:microcystin-dependent protein
MVAGANSFILTMKPDYQVGMLYPNMVVGNVAPRGFVFPDGLARSRITYGGLFYASSLTGTVTITIATPGVVTWTGNKLQNNDPIEFSTTGALPTGLAINTTYYVVGLVGSTFNVAATPGGAAINTTGVQSGVHTALHVPYGRGDGSTTFNVADIKGRVPVARDALGGTPASRITSAVSGITGDTLGTGAGTEGVALTIAQLAAHTHPGSTFPGNTLGTAGATVTPTVSSVTPDTSGPVTVASQGGGAAHPNVQPILVTSWLVKT